eukprot:3074503-Prymnesium_polylepis.2
MLRKSSVTKRAPCVSSHACGNAPLPAAGTGVAPGRKRLYARLSGAALTVEDLAAAEDVQLDWAIGQEVTLQPKLRLEHELHDAPPQPLDGRQYPMDVLPERRA